jgi:hypothetical protein
MAPNTEPTGGAVAVGVPAGLHGQADGALEIAVAPQQRRRHHRGVADRMHPVVALQALADAIAGRRPAGALGVQRHHLADRLGEAGAGRHLPERRLDGRARVVGDKGASQQRRHPQLTVDAVAGVRQAGVAERQRGGPPGAAG